MTFSLTTTAKNGLLSAVRQSLLCGNEARWLPFQEEIYQLEGWSQEVTVQQIIIIVISF